MLKIFIFNIGLAHSFFKRSAATLSETVAVQPPIQTSEAGESSLSKQNGDTSGTVVVAPPEFRFIYPEFLPDPDPQHRNRLKEKLERMDMLQRRSVVEIPEFYTGTIESLWALSRPFISFVVHF